MDVDYASKQTISLLFLKRSENLTKRYTHSDFVNSRTHLIKSLFVNDIVVGSCLLRMLIFQFVNIH